MLYQEGNRLVYYYDSEQVWIEPWHNNSLRIRATKQGEMPAWAWALDKMPSETSSDITIGEKEASITCGNITAIVSSHGKIVIKNEAGKILLEEFARNRRDVLDPKCSAIEVQAREFKARMGSSEYHLTWRLESQGPNERLYGMGQYQQPNMDLKGCDLEMAQRNSQASVPFLLSSLGYGLLWNNPSIGRAVLGKNVMSFEAYSTSALDCWITAGSTPAAIVQAYGAVTGTVPMMPEYGLGFWQCKLRYQAQDELLEVAREYKRRNLPIDLIVVDFFHWPCQGEWKFDPTYWPDPDAMVRELKEMGIELMVSVWPTVDRKSENYQEMIERGFLVRTERGIRIEMDFEGYCCFFDATNPHARKYVWQKAHKNYFSKGIKVFWLDEAEPEYSIYDFDNYRYHLGPNLSVGNWYPRAYAQTFYDGQEAEGQRNIVNLLRCAWAGSQKYGALVWSGDIASSWGSFRNQLSAGLNMGIAGIPWWTTDIGGFHGGDPNDPAFRELFVRWFQWGTFCPVMRLHGDREPRQPQHGETGGTTCRSGAANEVWSYGEEVYAICVKYMRIRELLRDYIRGLMRQAHERGSPVMRPLFYEFPDDETCWRVEDQYMFGSQYLICPILSAEQRKRDVYLPKGTRWELWTGVQDRDNGGEVLRGGKVIEVESPIDFMPVFRVVREP